MDCTPQGIQPIFYSNYEWSVGFSSGSAIKNPPAMQEPRDTWVQPLGQDEPLEEGMATHSRIPS